ncbi:MAG TPA: hypothetical protein VIY08_16195 [Candidatus Nitrosocosmicus sp.]
MIGCGKCDPPSSAYASPSWAYPIGYTQQQLSCWPGPPVVIIQRASPC